MTATPAAPREILREVFVGTGATFADERDRSQGDIGGVDVQGLLGRSNRAPAEPIHQSWPYALGLASFAGGAFLIAVAAMIISYRSLEHLETFRVATQAIDAAIAELPRLKSRIDVVSDELKREQATQQPVIEAASRTLIDAKLLEFQVRQTIESGRHELDDRMQAVKAQEEDVNQRLGKVEANQNAQASTLQTLQLRLGASEPATAKRPDVAVRSIAAYRLTSVRGGVATVAGPEGRAAVAVGDTLFDLGKVLKIANRGRKAVVTTEQGDLTLFWPRYRPRPKRAAAASL